MYDYEDYEKKCEEIRRENDKLLEIFEQDITGTLAPQTVSRHVRNAEFYLNNYLLYSEALPMEDGIGEIDNFLGNFFIRKCMWSTPASIKSTAVSIKKFYKCMMVHGKISKDNYAELCETIRDRMEWWQEDCAQFNDPLAVNPFMPF